MTEQEKELRVVLDLIASAKLELDIVKDQAERAAKVKDTHLLGILGSWVRTATVALSEGRVCGRRSGLDSDVVVRLTEERCGTQIRRALRAELHRQRGGAQPEVQRDVARLGSVSARAIFHIIQDMGHGLSRARRQPWRRI